MQVRASRVRLLEVLDERGDIAPSDDGYQVLWTGSGFIDASGLRIIANELDRRNAAWDATVKADLCDPPATENAIQVDEVNGNVAPASYSLEAIKEFAFSPLTKIEDLQNALLDIASHFDIGAGAGIGP